MSSELIAIISVGVAFLSVGVAVLGLMWMIRRDMLNGQVTLRSEMRDGFASQSRQIAEQGRQIAALGQRMAHLEGLLEGLREAFRREPQAT